MQLSPFPCHLVPLRSKYFPQHPILKHPQPAFLPQYQRPVSHPYKITGKIIVLYILIFKFLGSNLEDNRFCTEWEQAFPNFNLLLIYSWIEFWSVPRYLNSSTLSIEVLSIFTLWPRPAFRSRDITMFFVLSAFTSSPISFVAATNASAFSFTVCTLPPNMLTSSA